MENCRRHYADWREHRREQTPTQQEPAERIRKAFDGVTDDVNEKRLEKPRAEIRDDWRLGRRKHLLPWEKAALPPSSDEKHGIEV